jgi:glycosyltransferase involved in cell wall biosynthesis
MSDAPFAGSRLVTIHCGYGNPMRIAHVTPTAERVASGIQTAVEELARALSRRGHDVELWHVGDWSPPITTSEADKMRAAGVRFHRLPIRQRHCSPLPVVDVPVRDAVDVVHMHSVFVPSNTAIGRSWPGPVVLSPHGGFDPVSLRRSFFRKQVYSGLYEKSMIRRAATTVALTEVEAEQVRAFAGDVVTAVVPNGVAPCPTGIAGKSFRHSVGVPADARLAVFVGRLDVRHKGLDRLVAAAADAPTWRFLLVGPDHRGGHQRLQQRAADLGISARMYLVGQLEPASVAGAYAAADLFVLPSRWEGLPMSLLEALAQGLPSLVSPEVDRLVPVSRSGAGWVSAPSELGATLEAVAKLPTAEWSKVAQAARSLARSYDWDDVAAAYEAVYQEARQRWAEGTTAARGASPR